MIAAALFVAIVSTTSESVTEASKENVGAVTAFVWVTDSILWFPFLVSTIFTSIWMTLLLLSTTVVKMLSPLQRFTTWFFDVDRHPIQSIGIVAGALVMIGSLVWSIVRAVI
jgi:hypothetical protein